MHTGLKFMLIAVSYFTVVNVSLKYLKHLPVVEVVFFRALFSVVMSYIYLKKSKISVWGNNKPILFLRGAFGTVALTGFFYTVQVLPLGTAVTIQNLSPIFTLIVASFWLKENPKKIQWLFFLIAFLGVVLIKGFNTQIEIKDVIIGVLAAFGSGCAYASVRKLGKSEHPLVIVFYFPLITVPVMTPFVLYQWVTPQGIEWLFISLIGICTQLAQVYLTKAFQTSKAHEISMAHYVQIILSLIVGYILFNESLDWLSIVGIVIIMTSVLLNSYVTSKNTTSA